MDSLKKGRKQVYSANFPASLEHSKFNMADLVSHGPKMDWIQDSGLYSQFLDWKEVQSHPRRATQEKVSQGEGKLPQTMGRLNR